jgi:hypothetical protein
MAKRRASPHRGAFDKPEEIGHYAADFKILVGQGADERQILATRDLCSGLFYAFPQKTRSAEETISSLLQISPLKSLVADGEFANIAKKICIRHTPPIPHDHVGNAPAETNVNIISNAARSILNRSGLSTTWSSFAYVSAAMGLNLSSWG